MGIYLLKFDSIWLFFVIKNDWKILNFKIFNIYSYTHHGNLYKGATPLIWMIRKVGCSNNKTTFSKAVIHSTRWGHLPGAYWLALFECSLATGISGFWQVIKLGMDFWLCVFSVLDGNGLPEVHFKKMLSESESLNFLGWSVMSVVGDTGEFAQVCHLYQ